MPHRGRWLKYFKDSQDKTVVGTTAPHEQMNIWTADCWDLVPRSSSIVMFNAASGGHEGKLAIESAGQFRSAREDTTHERTSGSVVKGPKDDPTDALSSSRIGSLTTLRTKSTSC